MAALSPTSRPEGLEAGGRVHALGRAAASIALALGGLAIVVGLWQCVAWVSDPAQVPTPWVVFQAIRNNWDEIPALAYIGFEAGGIRDALVYTTVSVLVGVAIGTLIGLPLGITLARVRMARLLLEPPLLVMGTLPLLILLPFITLWFGTASFAQSALVIIFALLTVTFAAQSAAMAVSDHYANYAACLGASRNRVLWTVVLPAAGPNVLGATRLALAAGWGWQAIAELLGAREGAGRVIQVAAQFASVPDLLAIIVCLSIVAVICDGIVVLGGGLLLRWQE